MYTEIKKYMGSDPFTLECGGEQVNKNLTLHPTLIVDEYKALTLHIEIKDENDHIVHEYRLTLTKNLIKNLQDSIPTNEKCTCVDLNEEPMDKCYPESTSPEITVGKGWRQLLDEMSEEEKAKYTWKTGEELLNTKSFDKTKKKERSLYSESRI